MTALFANATAFDHASAVANCLALVAAVLLVRFIARVFGDLR